MCAPCPWSAGPPLVCAPFPPPPPLQATTFSSLKKKRAVNSAQNASSNHSRQLWISPSTTDGDSCLVTGVMMPPPPLPGVCSSCPISPQLSPHFLCRSCCSSVISSVIVRALNAFRVLGSRHTGGSATAQQTPLSAAGQAVFDVGPIGSGRLFSGRPVGSTAATCAATFKNIDTATFESILTADYACTIPTIVRHNQSHIRPLQCVCLILIHADSIDRPLDAGDIPAARVNRAASAGEPAV